MLVGELKEEQEKIKTEVVYFVIIICSVSGNSWVMGSTCCYN